MSESLEMNETTDYKKLLVALKFRFGEDAINPLPIINEQLAKHLLLDQKDQISREIHGEGNLNAKIEKQDKLLRRLAKIATQQDHGDSQCAKFVNFISDVPIWIDCTYKCCMLLAILIIFIIIITIYIKFKTWFK